MNCKQGDIAVVIEAAPRGDYRGLIVEVLEYRGIYGPTTHFQDKLPGTAKWLVRTNRLVRCVSGAEVSEFVCADIFLRPIRDPGAEATDETLNWLPVPHKEHA